MINFGTVKSLWCYPVKSMLGENCKELFFEERGVKGDRLYAITNAQGKFGSGKSTQRFRKIDGLLAFNAYYQNEQPMIEFPDGKIIAGNDPNIHKALTETFGQTVTLNQENKISHFDAGAVSIITSVSMDLLRSRLSSSTIEEQRFRPNIVIQTEINEPIENGKIIKLGEVSLEIVKPTERCVMVNLGQGNILYDPEILKCIAKEFDLCFGVYAKVIKCGKVCKNDDVYMLSPSQQFEQGL